MNLIKVYIYLYEFLLQTTTKTIMNKQKNNLMQQYQVAHRIVGNAGE